MVESAPNSFAALDGRRAIVTGSSSGIGLAIAEEFARAGADLVLHGRRSESPLESHADRLREHGAQVQVFRADVGSSEERHRFFQQVCEDGTSFDIWVNNAGVDLLTGAARDWSYSEKLTALFRIDVESTIDFSRRAADHFHEKSPKPSGVILNIGWDQSDRGMGGESGELFSTAKNAIMGFTRSFAVSVAPQTRVLCIAPGWIKTAWGETAPEEWQSRVLNETPLRRWGTPEDIAKTARFLVSSEAEYLTGQVINVNGGAVR